MSAPPPREAHSDLGASGMSRWANCPGSYRLCKGLPPRRSSVHAATGTVAHTLVEQALSGLDINENQGLEVEQEGHTVPVTPDLLEGVQVMVDYVLQTLRSCLEAGGGALTEIPVSLDPYFNRRGLAIPEQLFGRVDVLFLSDRAIEVVDFKNGAGVFVPVEDNMQLLYYAAAALTALNDDKRASMERVRLTIVQPHAPGQDKVRSWDLSALDLEIWMDTVLVPAVQAAAQPDAPLVPGAWCRFCPASHACPLLFEAAQNAAAEQFGFNKIHMAVLPGDDDLADKLALAERAQLWIDAVRAYAEDRLREGYRIAGWDLVPTRPVRSWRNEQAARQALSRDTNDLSSYLTPPVLRSPSQVEKALKAKGLVSVWETVSPEVQSVSGGLKLARRDTPASPSPFQPEEIP